MHKQTGQKNRKGCIGVDDNLSAQGSDLRARQTKRSSHVPEKLTPTPAFNLSVGFNFLAQGLEGTGSLFVGKEEE